MENIGFQGCFFLRISWSKRIFSSENGWVFFSFWSYGSTRNRKISELRTSRYGILFLHWKMVEIFFEFIEKIMEKNQVRKNFRKKNQQIYFLFWNELNEISIRKEKCPRLLRGDEEIFIGNLDFFWKRNIKFSFHIKKLRMKSLWKPEQKTRFRKNLETDISWRFTANFNLEKKKTSLFVSQLDHQI